MKEISLGVEDESSLSEISILPDGRVYLFGASRQVLELLQAIPLGDPALAQRIDGLHAVEAQESPAALVASSRMCVLQDGEASGEQHEEVKP